MERGKGKNGGPYFGAGWNLPLSSLDISLAKEYANFTAHEGTISDIQARIQEMRQNGVSQRVIDHTISILRSQINLGNV